MSKVPIVPVPVIVALGLDSVAYVAMTSPSDLSTMTVGTRKLSVK